MGVRWKRPQDLGFALIFFALCTSAYAISFFLPIILRENMGYSRGESQYLSAPPYVLACAVMWGMAWVGDKYHIRGPLLLGNCLLGLIGCPLLGWASQPGVRYFGTFLMCASAQGGIPTCMVSNFPQPFWGASKKIDADKLDRPTRRPTFVDTGNEPSAQQP